SEPRRRRGEVPGRRAVFQPCHYLRFCREFLLGRGSRTMRNRNRAWEDKRLANEKGLKILRPAGAVSAILKMGVPGTRPGSRVARYLPCSSTANQRDSEMLLWTWPRL